MGCDIHFHTEILVKHDAGNTEWLHYGQPNIPRDYDLFYLLAGIRGYDGAPTQPIDKPRGLPDDISTTTRLCAEYWGCDGHSHSFISGDDIGVVEKYLSDYIKVLQDNSDSYIGTVESKYWGYLFGNGWDSFKEYPNDYPPFLKDVRFVFWFDN